MPVDQDFCELHVSVKDHFSSLPYIDATTGLTTLDMPYEAAEIVDVLYEPKKSTLGTATVTFPSLLLRPELRPLLTKIKEGARVEFYNFQPDVGDPVFAGFVPPNGITQRDGKVTLAVHDPLVRGGWQHLRRIEVFNDAAAGLYTRALKTWSDLQSEDFSDPTAVNNAYGNIADAGVNVAGMAATKGALTLVPPTNLPNVVNNISVFGSGGFPGMDANVGDLLMFEADVTLAYSNTSQGETNGSYSGVFCSWPGGGLNVELAYTMVSGPGRIRYRIATIGGPTVYTYADYPDTSTSLPNPDSFHLVLLLRVVSTSSVRVTIFKDRVQIYDQVATGLTPVPGTTGPGFSIEVGGGAADKAILGPYRIRRLVPYVNRAARFNPQTADAVYYQPNNDDGLAFLRLWLEKDNAEYRLNYKAAPTLDELELDAVGTLGVNASAVLGYSQAGVVGGGHAPVTTPATVTTDTGAYAVTPPFRFEEGYNLASAPTQQPSATAHANDVIRMGANQQDAQVSVELWKSSETGNVALGIAGTYPIFEQVSNDDRVALPGVAKQLATYELARRTDATPSLGLEVVAGVEDAFRWRAGDSAMVITRSLLTNFEQTMRIAQIRHQAGNPLRQVDVGRLPDTDQVQAQLLHESMLQNWLFEQSGASPLTYVYPMSSSPLSIAAGATSPTFTFPLDQFVTGGAIISAYLHWVVDGTNGIDVLAVTPVINGQAIVTTALTKASVRDSGLQLVTNYFAGPAVYTLAFKNTGGAATGLSVGFLVIRVKMP